jgi:hypothetical protein
MNILLVVRIGRQVVWQQAELGAAAEIQWGINLLAIFRSQSAQKKLN